MIAQDAARRDLGWAVREAEERVLLLAGELERARLAAEDSRIKVQLTSAASRPAQRPRAGCNPGRGGRGGVRAASGERASDLAGRTANAKRHSLGGALMEAAQGLGLGTRRERVWLALLVAIHIALGIYWGAVIPLFEAHDEVGHYYHVRYIARHGRLVPPGEQVVDLYDESRQPPAYYVLAALPVSLINTDDGPPYTPNPYAGWDRGMGGLNTFLHDWGAEAFPWRGGVLAVHVARAVSTLLGALTLLATYAAGNKLAPARWQVRWGATLGLALWPQFRFGSSVINNDSLVTLAGALMLFSLIGLVRCPRRGRWPWILAAGASAALAAVSKNNGLQVAAVGVLVVLWTALFASGRHGWRFWVAVAAVSLAGLAAVGWWYARNLSGGQGALALPFMDVWIYQFRQLFTGESIGLAQFARRLGTTGRFAWRSFWAAFGWGNVGYPGFFYWLAGAWCLGCVGLLLPRRPDRASSGGAVYVALLMIAAVLLPTWLLYVATGIPHLQGRYLLPALPALVLLVSLGWDRLLPPRVVPAFWGGCAACGLALALATPVAVIQPAYAPPEPMEAERLAELTPTLAVFGEVAELVGYQVDPVLLDAGELLDVRLALRSQQRSQEPLTLAVKAYDQAGRLVGGVHRYPGRGSLDTTRWDVDVLFEEHMTLEIAPAAVSGVGRLEISFYQADTPTSPLVVRDAAGTKLGRSLALLDAFRIGDGAPPPEEVSIAVRFGEALASTDPSWTLACTDGGLSVRVAWAWQALAEMEADYRFSLQVRSPDEAIVAQADGLLGDAGVPTLLWAQDEVMPQQVALPLPTRSVRTPLKLYLVVYDPVAGTRLPVRVGDDDGASGDELLLGAIGDEDLAAACAAD